MLSLTGFTALKTIRLSQSCLGTPPEPDDGFAEWQEYDYFMNVLRRDRNDLLVNVLPRSLEFLEIEGFEDYYEQDVVEFARRASLTQYPHLKHVRLVGVDVSYLTHEKLVCEQDVGPYHDIESLVPPEYWNDTEVRRAMIDAEVDLEARNYFLKAGVKFETLELNWPVSGDWKHNETSGFIMVYPQACTGDCNKPNCGGQAPENGGSQ